MPPQIDFVPDAQNDEGTSGAIDFQPDQAAAEFAQSALDFRPTFIPTLPAAETSPKLEAAKEMALAIPQAFGIGLGAVEKGVGAAIGQVAGTGDNLDDVRRAVEEGTPLPVELAAERTRGIGGTLARVGLGLAETAPKIATMALFPEGILAQSIAAGGIFGLDAQGRFSPRAAAVGALLPGAGALAKGTVARALAGAMERGTIGTMHPATQWITEEMGHQAALNAVMLTADSPELIELYHTDRDAFRRKIEDTIGMNLAFGLFGGIKRLRGAPTATQEYVRKNAEKFGKIADNMITQQIVGGAGQQAIEKAIAEAKSRQKYAGFIKFPGDEDVAGSAQPMPPSGEEPPGFVPVAGPQLPPIEPKGPANAVQIGIPAPLPVEVPPEARPEVGGQVREPEEPAEARPPAEPAPPPVEPAKPVEPPKQPDVPQLSGLPEEVQQLFAGTPPPPKKKSIPIVIEIDGVQQPAYFEGYGTTATSLEPTNPWISRLSDGGWTTGPIQPDAKIVWGKIPEAPKPAEQKQPAEPAPEDKAKSILDQLRKRMATAEKPPETPPAEAPAAPPPTAPDKSKPISEAEANAAGIGSELARSGWVFNLDDRQWRWMPTEAKPSKDAPNPEETVVREPNQLQRFVGIVKLAADSPDKLRSSDVDRVMSEVSPEEVEAFRTWLLSKALPEDTMNGVVNWQPEAPTETKPPTEAGPAMKYGVPAAQFDEMAKYNNAEQMAKWGVTRAQIMESYALSQANKPSPEVGAPVGNKIRQAIEQYEGTGEIETIQDLVNRIEELAAETDNGILQNAVARFRNAQEEDQKLAGRGDMDEAEEAFLRQIEKAADFDDRRGGPKGTPRDKNYFPQYPKPLTKEERKKNVFGAVGKRIKAWEASIKQWLTGRPENKAIIWEEREIQGLEGPVKGNVKALTRNIGDDKNPWRVTVFNERNGAYMPFGHRVYPTREAALVEEARDVLKLHDSMPGRVMDEQEVQGYKLMKDVPDPSTLVWYKFSGDPRILRERLRGTALMQDFVRDSQTADGKVAFTKPVTADLQDPAKIADRLKWLQLEEIAPEKPAEREIKIVYDEDYKGPRYRYGMRNRPLQIGAQPKGWIIGSDKPHPDFKNFGTIDYPFPLTKEELYSYELVDLGEVKPTLPPAASETGTVPSGVSKPTEGGKAPTGQEPSMTAELGESPGRSAAAIRTDIRNAKAEIKRLTEIQKRLSKIGDKAAAAKRQRKIDALKSKLSQYNGELTFKTVTRRKREPGTLSEGITPEDGLLFDVVALGRVPIFMPDGIVMAQYKRLKSLSFRTPAQVEALNKILESFPADFEGNFGVDGSIARAAWDAAKRAGIENELFVPVKDGRRMMIDADFLEPLRRSKGVEFKTREFFEELTRLANARYERTKGRGSEAAEGAAAEREVRQGEALKEDLAKRTKDTTVLIPDNIAIGTQFTLKGTRLRVTDLEFDEDGRLLWVMLDDGNKYGTQRIDLEDGRTELRMDIGSLKQPKAMETADEFLSPEEAEPTIEAPKPAETFEQHMAREEDMNDWIKSALQTQRPPANAEEAWNKYTAFERSRGVDVPGKEYFLSAWESFKKPVAPKPEVTPESIRKQLNRGYYNDAAGATWKVQQGDNGQFYVERTFNGDRQAGRESYDTIEEAQASAVEQIQGKPPIPPPAPKPAEKPAEQKLTPEEEWAKEQAELEKSAGAVITVLREVPALGGEQKHAATGIATGRGGQLWSEALDGKFTPAELEAARRWLMRAGYTDTRLVRAVEGATPKADAPKPKPATEPKLSAREQKRLSDLQMKDRAYRDAIGRNELGEALTAEEQREYEALTAKAGQRTLFDVDEVVAETSRPVLEGQLRNLEEKLAELKRQQLLSLTNAQNRQMGGDKAKEFMDAARTYEKRIQEAINEIVDIKRKLRIGLNAEEYKAAPVEPTSVEDLFSQPERPKAPTPPKAAEPVNASQENMRAEIADIERKLQLLDLEWTDANGKNRKKKAMELGSEINKLNMRLNLLRSDLTEGQGEVVLRTPIAENPLTGEYESREYRLRQMTSQEFMDYFKDPMQRMQEFDTVYTPWRAEMRRVYYDESGKETRHDPWYIDAIQKTREGAIEKAASYSGRSAEGWKEVLNTLNKPKGPEISPEQPSAPISAGKKGVSKGAGAAAQPVAGLTEAESARLAELTAKVEANEPMTKAERERFIELQTKAGARGGDERPEVRPGGDEPPANLGGGLEPGQGMRSEAEVLAAIAGEDTAGFPVKVITQQQAVELTGRAEAKGYGGFFWKGSVYMVRDNLSPDPKYREQVRQLLREEVGHGLLRTQAGLRLLSEVLDAGKLNLTDAERQKLLDMGYREHQLLDEFIAKSARENLPWWKEMVERARVMLSKLGLAKLSNEEVSRMLLRQIRAQVRKQAELQRPSIRTKDGATLRAPGLIEINPPVFPAIVAHHGTPHQVDRFSLEKVGTGEGAQVYGWGLYFAENKEVASRYREQLSGPTLNTGALWWRIMHMIHDRFPGEAAGGLAQDILGTPPSRRRLDFPRLSEEDVKLFDEYSRSKTGNEYTVTIEVEPGELLDWHTPINQQSQKVQDAVLRGPLAHANYRGATGAEIYNELSQLFKTPAKNLPDWVIESEMFRGDSMVGSDRQASQYLKSLGIKGIRYLDQGSRNPQDLRVAEGPDGQFRVWDAGNGGWFTGDLGAREQAERWLADHPQYTPKRTYNYVIFDDSIIKITEQNGKPVKPSDVLPEEPAPSPAVGGKPLPGFERMRSPRTKIKDLKPGDLIRFNGNLFGVDRVQSDAVMKNEAKLFLSNEQGSGSVTIGNKNDPLSNWEPVSESVLQSAGLARFREGPAPAPAVGREPEIPTPEGERPSGPKMGVTQVAGEKIGIERPMEFIAGIRQRLRTGYFDGSQPVEPGRTENAWQIAQMMVNPETRGTFASDLQRAGGGEMAPGLLRNELWDYAVRQAVRGDTSLMEFMVRQSQNFQTLAGEALADGDTALGRGLRAARNRAFGGLWSRLIGFRNEQLAATGRRLQQGEAGLRQIIEAIDGLVANIGDIDAFERGLRTPEIQRIIDRTSDTGRAADEVVGNATFVPPERRASILETVYQWMSREVDPRSDQSAFTDTLKAELERLRLTPEQAQTIADATWNRKLTVDGVVRRRLWDKELRKLDALAEKTADSFILSVDQAEWKRPEQPNEVRDIIKEALKSEAPLDSNNLLGFKRDLTQRLITAGLSEEKARDLANAITTRRETDLLNAQLRVRNRAVESKSLKSLVESLRSSPYLAQNDPQWRFDTAVRWFESNGVPREQAQEAAKLFDEQFVAALTKAAEQAAKRLITKGDYGRNIPELIEAIRLGLTDPSKNWTEEIAKREGFRPMSREDQQRLAELEQKYSNPNLSAHEQVALVEQMMGIVRHAGDSKGRVMQIMGESFAASLLSGIRTMTLNWMQPWFTMLATGASHAAFEPRDFPTVVRSMWNASKNWWPEYKYAWSKDAYELSSEEQVFHSNALKTAFEDAQTDWAKGRYSQAILKFTYGWQQYVIRGLQAADQAGMVVAREWKMALYGSIAMRAAGLKTAQITEMVDVAEGFKRAEYERALYDGKSHNEAQVIANEATIDALTNFFENKLGSRQKAEAVEEAALYDAFNIVGRRAPGVDESDEGFLSRYSGLNRIMRFVSETRREGGGASILTIMAVGFMNVPLRTARFYAGFGPYGILRWGIDKYRTNRGYAENLWKQSYKNEYQSKARLREALIGTSLMLAFLGWQHRHHTSDEDAEKKAFAMYVTGNGPSNKTMRDAWLKRGFEPYTLHVIANGKIRSKLPVNRVGQILAFPLGLAASLDDLAWRRKQEEATSPGSKKEFAGREIVAAMGTYYNIVGAQGVLQAFSHLSQIGQGQSGTGRAVGVSLASTASALAIPGKSLIQGVTDMITGPVDRSSVEAAMISNFPVLNVLWNGQAINRFGDPIGDRTWSAKLTKLGFPVLLRVSDTPENKALYQMILDKGAPPPDLRRYIVEDKYGPLSQDDWQKFVKISGSALKSEVLSNLDTLNGTDPHGVKLFMNRAADIANDQAAQALHLTPKPTFSASSGSSGDSAVPTLPKSNVGLPSSARISVPGGASGGRISTGGGSRGYGGGFGPGTTGIRRGTTGRLSLSGFTGGQRRFVHGRLRAHVTRVRGIGRKSRVSIPRRSFRRRRISLRA